MAKTTEIILLQDVLGLGEEGDIRRVKPGYARNYLIPHKMAETATALALVRLKKRMAEIEGRRSQRREVNKDMFGRLDGKVIEVVRRAGQSDKLFGSVTAHDVLEALSAEKITINKGAIIMYHPIKTLGEHRVGIRLQSDLVANLVVKVTREGEAEVESLDIDKLDDAVQASKAESTEATS